MTLDLTSPTFSFLIYKIRSIFISPFHPRDDPCLQSVVPGQHRQSRGPILPGGSGAQNRKELKTQEGKLRQKHGFNGSVQNDWGREKNTIKDVYQDLSSATYIILIIKTVLLGTLTSSLYLMQLRVRKVK